MQEYQFCHHLLQGRSIRVWLAPFDKPITDISGTFVQNGESKMYFPREKNTLQEVILHKNEGSMVIAELYEPNLELLSRKVSENKMVKSQQYNSIGETKNSTFLDRLLVHFNCKKRLIITEIDQTNSSLASGNYANYLLQAGFRGIRESINQRFFHGLPSPHAELGVGILFGQDTRLPQELYTNLQIIGLLHVVAASGYNLSVLAQFLRIFLKRFFTPQFSAWITMAFLWSFLGINGGSPSVSRAVWMASLTLFSLIVGRQLPIFFIFWISCALMMLWDPAVLFSTSFHLSFASTLGILLFCNNNSLYQPKVVITSVSEASIPLLEDVKENFRVTVSALSLTVPIVAARFHQISIMAIPANLLLGPLIPIMMFSSLLFLIGTFFGPVVTIPFATLYWFLSNVFTSIVNILAHFSYAQLTIAFPWWLVVVWWVAVLSIARFLTTKTVQK